MRKETDAITKAYCLLRDIEDCNDLKKYGFTLADYDCAFDVMKRLGKPGSSCETLYQNVAIFFKKCGFSVKEKGIGFLISI